MWQTAGVRCDDETWVQWRRVLGERSVAEALGAYVAGEVLKAERQRASQGELDDHEVRKMLERVEDAQATLADLMDSLERRIQPRRF